MYDFTEDWFHWAPELWLELAKELPTRLKFLEIGSYEGRSAIWMAENIADPGATILCIDTWEGGEDHSDKDMRAVEARFDANVTTFMQSKLPVYIQKVRTPSSCALATLRNEHTRYDFIYIDGDHRAPGVLTDAVMAWQLLRQRGIMVFDDYTWGNARDILHRPKLAIDSFVNCFAEELEVLHVGYQLAVRKR